MSKLYLFLLLLSTEGLFAQTTYYVAPNGNDSHIGSQSQPWASLKESILKLMPGDTLLVRGGTYNENGISINVMGTPSAKITIKNFPNEHPIFNGSFLEFRTTTNSDWEVYDASKNIYRSTKTYPTIDSDVYGYMADDNENWRLLSYERFDPFISNNQNFAADGNTYCGPGIYYNSSDKKIYVRLEHSNYQHDLSRFSQEYNFPANINPQQTKLFIFSDAERLFNFGNNAAYITIEGIDLKYASTAVYFSTGAHHITLMKCKVMGGRYDIQIRNLSHDIVIDNLDFNGYYPPWMSRSDVKKPSGVRPLHLMQGAAISIVENPYNIEILNSNFQNHFDAIDATKGPNNIHIHHNVFDVIKDDVLQLGSASYDIEINNNIMKNVTAGVSWNGSGQPPSGKVGTKYIHHNIIDASTLTLYGRIDPDNQLDDKNDGPFGTGMATGRAFGMHTKSSITGPDPWKIYHNTLIIGQDVDRGGTGVSYDISQFDTNIPHEVYNNIILQKWDVGVPSDFYAFMIRDARVKDGSQIFDGNLYYRTITSTSSFHSIFKDIATVFNGSAKDFEHLNDFKNNTEYISYSKQYYAAGWENAGVEGNPELDGNYLPTSTGLAASGAIDLSTKGWPGLIGETFRGALNPNTSSQILTSDAGEDKTITCTTPQVTIGGSNTTNGATYAWTTSNGNITAGGSTKNATVDKAGAYTLTVSKSGSTTVTDDVVVTEDKTPPTADAGADQTINSGESTQLTATGGGAYVWSPTTGLSNANIANPTASPTADITYTVTVTSSNGCTDTDQVKVMVNGTVDPCSTPPIADAGEDVTMEKGNSTQLTATGGVIYSWSPPTGLSNADIANPIANPTTTTNYTVTVIDDNGCIATDEVMITIAEGTLKISNNSFSPNGDNINDIWNIEGLKEYPNSEMTIYNRWGNKVFTSSKGYSKPWDGMYNGKLLPMGTYFYILKLGDDQIIKGNVNIIK